MKKYISKSCEYSELFLREEIKYAHYHLYMPIPLRIFLNRRVVMATLNYNVCVICHIVYVLSLYLLIPNRRACNLIKLNDILNIMAIDYNKVFI